MSCLSTTFTSVLNDRLYELSDEVGLISESQTGLIEGIQYIGQQYSAKVAFSIFQSLKRTLTTNSFKHIHVHIFFPLILSIFDVI